MRTPFHIGQDPFALHITDLSIIVTNGETKNEAVVAANISIIIEPERFFF